ncbi:ATP-binding protein [Nitrosomonas sp.]
MFEDRIEISNPGTPLVKPERMVDLPPRSRNEALTSLMRRMKI